MTTSQRYIISAIVLLIMGTFTVVFAGWIGYGPLQHLRYHSFPKEAAEVLQGKIDTSITLYALDPSGKTGMSTESYHTISGYEILGQIQLEGTEAAKTLAASAIKIETKDQQLVSRS